MMLNSLCLLSGLLSGLGVAPLTPVADGERDLATSYADDMREPGPRPADTFHPDHQPDANGVRPAAPEPAYGGRVILHLESMPKNLNRVLENSSVTRNMHLAMHDVLVRRDWESWEYEPRLCRSWDTEDMLVLKPEAAERYGAAVQRVRVRVPGEDDADGRPVQRESHVLFGRVVQGDGGDYRIEPVSRGNPLEGPTDVAAADVVQLERGSVFTFNLRDDVYWHPAPGAPKHKLDARDVHFSWSVYQNPGVDCDQVRYQYLKITRGEVVDPSTVRFFYESQYFAALGSVGESLMLLPSHLYDLTDPDHAEHRPDATAKEIADHVNGSPYNQDFVGLGPYRVVEQNQEFIEVERFVDYYDSAHAGYFDTIRWRYIQDDNTAFQALLNGEIDFFNRVKSADYFGQATRTPAFTKELYAGHFYYPSFGFTAWNTHRPELRERAVRVAIAHAFDFDTDRKTTYKGVANQVTGPFAYVSPAYDHGVKPFPYDPDRAIELLEDAGWYDRNGDGVADKDGVELELDFMLQAGNDAAKNFALRMQESLAEIGVRLRIEQVEWATLNDRLQSRDYDCSSLAWSSALEEDPEQLWHSKWGGEDVRSSNFSGTQDPELDALIERGQRELDFDRRQDIWHEIHRRVYANQPFLFLYNLPRKFALNKKVRGVQFFALRPGYNPVRWYYPKGTPGTRATLTED